MAGQYFTGTLLASPVVRGSSGDTYGTHHSVLGVGGYIEVGTIAQRNALPVDSVNGIYFDGLSSGQRRLGMLVHVLEENNIYRLLPNVPYPQWVGYTNTQKLNALSNNANWVLFITSGSTFGGGQKISTDIYQLTHGFIVGNVIGYNGTIYIKVSSLTASTVEPLGIVSTVKDLNNFTLTYAGYINTTNVVDYSGGTLNAGKVYYLSSLLGKITKNLPTNLNEVSKPVLVALASGNTSIVLQYRGFVQSQQGVSIGQFNTYTGTTQQFLNKTVTGATNIGYFSGYTGVQHLVISNTANSSYNGTYNSVYNNYYRDTNGIIRIGSPTFGGVLRRGYVRTSPTPIKSWIYNQYIGASNQVGWILVNGDITQSVGNFLTAYPAVGAMYTGITWNTGAYNNGGDVVLSVSGSLITGTTYNIGGPIYKDKQYQQLRLRTIVSKNNKTINVTYDDNFVYLSGATFSGSSSGGTKISGVTDAVNIGSGDGIYSSKINNILQLKSLIPSGNTTIIDKGDSIIIHSSGSNVINVIMLNTLTYTATVNDEYIGALSGSTINLTPAPNIGQKLIIADISGCAYLKNIMINGNGMNINDSTSAIINTNYGSLTFVNNGNFWNPISFIN